MIDPIMLITSLLMKGPLSKIIYIIGFIGTFVMIFWVPIRIAWVLKIIVHKYKNGIKNDYIAQNFLLFLSIAPYVEFIFKARNGTSGLFLIALSPIPFFIYIASELTRKIKND